MNPPQSVESEPFSSEKLIDQITDLEPLPVASFTPAKFEEGIEDFISSGDKRTPSFEYPNLSQRDSEEKIESLMLIADQIENELPLPEKHKPVYLAFIESSVKKHELIAVAGNLQDEAEDSESEIKYVSLSKECYGEPDTRTFLGLVNELRESVLPLDLEDEAAQVRDELLGLLPETGEAKSRFKPREETVEYYKQAINELFGGMFQYVPEDKDSFTPEEIKEIFSNIIEGEFGDGANGWRVEVTDSKAIKVETPTKTVHIPENRSSASKDKLKGLIAHELGVHMMRSVMGEDTDMRLLKLGLSDYYDSEEGLGKVFEQAVNGKAEDSGIQYYLAASMLLGIDGKQRDFRDVYEVMWRRKLLENIASGQDMTEEAVQKAKKEGFKQVHRITRGTNKLPFLKDLAYFRGTDQMWRHLEAIKGDEFAFSLLLLGKADPLNRGHRQTLLESRSV